MTTEQFSGWPTPEQLIPTSAPEQVLVDITNRCPLSCIQCPVPMLRQRPEYVPGDMSVELFHRLVDQIPEGTILTITGDGEPMVVRRIAEMIKYGTDKGVVIRLITSGLIMNEKTMRELLEANLNFMDFSLDAATRESYDLVRLDSNYDKVTGHVNRFLQLRREIQGEKPTTKVLVSMIDQPITHHEIPMFHQKWQGQVDRVYVRPLHAVAGLVTTEFSGDNQDMGNPPHRRPCRILYDRLVVDYKGRVFFCPLGWGREEAVLGDIISGSIQGIWNGAELNALREAHINHAIPSSRLCFNCRDWKGFGFDNSSGQYLNQLKNNS